MTDSTTTTHEDRIIASDTMPALTVTFEALWLGREQVGYVVLSGLPLFVTSDEARTYLAVPAHCQTLPKPSSNQLRHPKWGGIMKTTRKEKIVTTKIAVLRFYKYDSDNGCAATTHVSFFVDMANIVYIKSAHVTIDRTTFQERDDKPTEIGFASGHTITVPLSLAQVRDAIEAAVEVESFIEATKPKST